jgi:hypothetical protein
MITTLAAREQCAQRSYGNVQFRACVDDAKNLYVLVRSHPGRAYVLASMQCVDGEWQATLRLPRGRYRYRYYAEFDGALVYASPADVEQRPVSMGRFDAEFCIGDQLCIPSATYPGRPQIEAERFAQGEGRDGWYGSVHG